MRKGRRTDGGAGHELFFCQRSFHRPLANYEAIAWQLELMNMANEGQYHGYSDVVQIVKFYDTGLFGQKCLECLMFDHHISNRPKLLPALFLLLQQFPPPTDITGMELSQDIFAIWFDSFSSNDLFAHGSLDDDLKELSINMLFELGHPQSALAVDLAHVHDPRDGIDRNLVHQKLQLDNVACTPCGLFIVKTGIALGGTLELAEEIINKVG